MIVTMSPQPYDFHYAEANQNSSSSTYNYPSAPDYMSWTATSYEYPSASTAITLGADDETIWSSVTSTSLDDPSMFASTTDSNWPQYNTPLESQNSWTPSVNPSSAVSVPDAGMWSSADYYNTPTSPYSDTAVPSNQSVSYSQGSTSRRDSTVTSFLSSARIPSASGPSSPSSYQASEAASTLSSMAKTKTAPKKKASEPKPKSTSSKRKAPSNSTSSTQPSKQPPLKPSKPKVNIPSAANGTLASEQGYQAQLLARFGSSIPPLGPAESKDPRAAADRIRREAWRICKAEALEMSQRRVKLLEHEQGALERETLQLQVNIGLMREAINKEQEELREAVGRAERLAKGDL